MAILSAGFRLAGWSTGGAPGTKGTRLGMLAMLASPGTCMKYMRGRRQAASEQQVQRVGEGSQVWICKISMDCCSKGGCVVSPENNVSVTQQVREGHHCCDESEQLALIDLRLQVASVHNNPFNNGGGHLAITVVIQASFFVVHNNSEAFTGFKNFGWGNFGAVAVGRESRA